MAKELPYRLAKARPLHLLVSPFGCYVEG